MKNKLKLVATVILKFAAILFYRIICFIRPIKSNRIVFVTPRHDSLKDNLFFLYTEMKEKNPELEYIIMHRNAGRLTSVIYFLKTYYFLATARFYIIDDYFLPLYFVKVRPGTEVVQLWHASGPLKKVGLSLRGHANGPSESYLKVVPIHRNYDYIFVNSDIERPIYSEAFGTPIDRIFAVGTPRTDLTFNNINNQEVKKRFITKHPEFKGKELILYAPTFRGRSNDNTPYQPSLNLEKIPQILEEKNKVLLFNLHPYMKGNKELVNVTDNRAVFWNKGEYSIEDLLLIADALISDYSSVIYDFAILEKPIALYCYDYEEYKEQRGFYTDVKYLMPNAFFEKEKDLLSWIMDDNKSSEEAKLLKMKNFKYQDGQATSRIINVLLKGLNGGNSSG